MKKSLIYLTLSALALSGSVALTSCDDNFERPPMVVPEATIEANTTIAELKADFYQGDNNYATEIGTKANGEHYIIAGYVTSSDQAGNYFKQIVIQDETSAIQISVDAYDLYQSYQVGQELVIDVTGLYIGAYGRLMQLGAAPSSGYPSRIAEETFNEHAQRNGLGNADNVKVQTVTVSELNALTPGSDEWLAYQNRYIKVDNVTFQNAGKETLSTSGSNGVSQPFGNSDGQLILYTSGYSDFYQYYCPEGVGNVVGILSCYRDTWQVRLNSIEGLEFENLTEQPGQGGGDNPNPPSTENDGSEAKPYSVADVIGGATGTDVWMKGYIVGWIADKSMAESARFDATDVTVQSNILVAASADVKDVAACVPVQLPAGDVRNALNLQTHPDNLGKEVMLKGSLEKYFGAAGMKSTSAYKIDGQGGDEPAGPTEPVASINEGFEGGAIPAGWTQVQLAGNKSWYTPQFNNNYYAAMTGYKGTAPFDQFLLTPAIDMAKAEVKTLTFDTQVNGYGSTTSKLEVYVVTDPAKPAETGKKLDAKFATAPASGYSQWLASGTIDLSSYTGVVYIAFRYTATNDANYATWCVDNVKVNVK